MVSTVIIVGVKQASLNVFPKFMKLSTKIKQATIRLVLFQAACDWLIMGSCLDFITISYEFTNWAILVRFSFLCFTKITKRKGKALETSSSLWFLFPDNNITFFLQLHSLILIFCLKPFRNGLNFWNY